MAYTTRLHVAEECSGVRLRDLVRSLQRFDCLVRLEPPVASAATEASAVRLEVRVPADGYTWIVRGGFGALIETYADVVRWRAGFDEIPDKSRHAPSLPAAPRRG